MLKIAIGGGGGGYIDKGSKKVCSCRCLIRRESFFNDRSFRICLCVTIVGALGSARMRYPRRQLLPPLARFGDSMAAGLVLSGRMKRRLRQTTLPLGF